MRRQNDNGSCYDPDCPYQKPHRHIKTNDGVYVKYIIEKAKKMPVDYASYQDDMDNGI